MLNSANSEKIAVTMPSSSGVWSSFAAVGGTAGCRSGKTDESTSARRDQTPPTAFQKRVHDGFSLRPTDDSSIPQREARGWGRRSAHPELRFAQRRQRLDGGAPSKSTSKSSGAKSGVLPSIKLGSWLQIGVVFLAARRGGDVHHVAVDCARYVRSPPRGSHRSAKRPCRPAPDRE